MLLVESRKVEGLTLRRELSVMRLALSLPTLGLHNPCDTNSFVGTRVQTPCRSRGNNTW
jgi:hypothetical protein